MSGWLNYPEADNGDKKLPFSVIPNVPSALPGNQE